ncbi:glycoside hydrolase family 26 protein [Arthrobacter sp. MDT1-48-3]
MGRKAVLALVAALVVCLGVVLFLPRPAGTQAGHGQDDVHADACGNVRSGEIAPAARSLPASGGPAPAGLPPISGERPALGIATEGGFGSPAQWDEAARALGESPSLIMAYSDFTAPLPVAGLEAVAARGATPVLTWEPWEPAAGPGQTRFALAGIAAGHHDAYLQQWAASMRSYGRPVLLRFAHEMNSPWYPWGAGTNGNTPADYVAAWRHVHGLFDAAGVDNVSWVWNPEAPECDSPPLSAFYPGHDYVDVVGLDGYNWGTSRENETWRTPEEIFAEGLHQLRRLAPGSPVLIGETASTDEGGSKPAWTEELVEYLAAQPDVQAFVWFDHDKESDWRFASSDASREALRAALASR